MALRPGLLIGCIRGLARQSRVPLSLPRAQNPPKPVILHSSTFQRSIQQFGGLRFRPQYQRFNDVSRLKVRWQTSPGFRKGIYGVVVSLGVIYYINLEVVPISGRRRFNICPAKFEALVGQKYFEEIMQQAGSSMLSRNHPVSLQVKQVMRRLLAAAGEREEDWEIRVLDDPSQKQAFVIAGGKAFVFSGILPICQNEDGLAAVLGHEIAHNIAHHTGEKLSQQGFIIGLACLLAWTVDATGYFVHKIADLALTLPASRKQESEADYIGLLIMAKACYDPEAAVAMWQRMAAGERNAPPQFLSTHPASRDRMAKLKEWMPEAIREKDNGGCSSIGDYGT